MNQDKDKNIELVEIKVSPEEASLLVDNVLSNLIFRGEQASDERIEKLAESASDDKDVQSRIKALFTRD